MFTRAIIRQPAPNFSEGLTKSVLGPPDYERALRQHEAYCAALEKSGLSLVRLEPDVDYPDSCFVEDAALLIGALPDSRAADPICAGTHPLTRVVLTRPGAATRQGEAARIGKALNDLFPPDAIHEIEAPGTIDGGDVCDAGNHFFIGLSQRTNEAGAQQLAEILAKCGYTSSVVDIRGVDGLLHFKSGVAYLGDNRLAVTQAVMSREAFASYDLIPVPAAEQYAANCLRVNDHVLIAAGYPAFEGQLGDVGYQTIALEMSEFQKMDGGLSCLSLRF